MTFYEFEKQLQKYYVFNVQYKEESWLMRLLGTLMFFNPKFMNLYVTTLGNNIYFPSREWVRENDFIATNILAHEMVHIRQGEKYGAAFPLLYLFPQIFAVFSLLAILAVFWLPFLWCLMFLIFLAPIPAPWRAKFEFEAYVVSLFMTDLQMRHRNASEEQRMNNISVQALRIDQNQFKGPDYWFMWPFGVEDDFAKKIEDIKSGVISDTDEVYGRIARSYMNTVSAYD